MRDHADGIGIDGIYLERNAIKEGVCGTSMRDEGMIEWSAPHHGEPSMSSIPDLGGRMAAAESRSS